MARAVALPRRGTHVPSPALLLAVALSQSATAEPIFKPYGSLVPAVEEQASPSFADIDADGDLDAFVGDRLGRTNFFRNLGTTKAPSFSYAHSLPNPFGLTRVKGHASPAFVDIDADGDLDAFICSGVDIVFFRNTGTARAPSFGPAATNPFGLAGLATWIRGLSFPDIDGDGDFDAFVGEFGGDTFLFMNAGVPTAPAFAQAVPNPFGLANVGAEASPTFADLDGDGDLDAAVGGGYGGLTFFQNVGGATVPAFDQWWAIQLRTGLSDLASPTFADIDDDGDLDALVGDSTGKTSFFANLGTASAPRFSPSTNPFGLELVSRPHLVDIDADGDLDLFDEGYVYENVGSGGDPVFAPPAIERPPPGPFGDIDADGDLDSFGGGPTYFENVGTASGPVFTERPTINIPPLDLFSIAISALADIDADGDLDLFLSGDQPCPIYEFCREPVLLVLTNVGTASTPIFSTPVANPFGLGYGVVAFADLDGDGDLDAAEGGGIKRNSGTPSHPAFGPPLSNVAFLGQPAFGDLDADGDLDAVVHSHNYYPVPLSETIYYENREIGPKDCSDSIDNDEDGYSDLQDRGCPSGFDLSEQEAGLVCDDGIDNDYDELADAADAGCADSADASELIGTVCDDWIDNDSDGSTDMADSDCTSPTDSSERSDQACRNGLDDDGDGLIDLADPVCVSGAALSERAQCQDGLDNDGDGRVDFDGGRSVGVTTRKADRQCAQPWKDTERKQKKKKKPGK